MSLVIVKTKYFKNRLLAQPISHYGKIKHFII